MKQIKLVVVQKVRRGKHLFWNDEVGKFTTGLQYASLILERDAKMFFEASIEDASVKLLPAKIVLVNKKKVKSDLRDSWIDTSESNNR